MTGQSILLVSEGFEMNFVHHGDVGCEVASPTGFGDAEDEGGTRTTSESGRRLR